jgi:prepilin-type N-terminal cleavage/methylation domain-containing protein
MKGVTAMSKREAANKDAGFTLVETLVSLAIIGTVLTAVSTFFVRSMVITTLEGARQAAVEVADAGMEQLRAQPGALALSWLVDNVAAKSVPMGTTTFTRTWDMPSLSNLMPATVHVTWTSNGCPGNVCSYSATTLISTTGVEPVFDPATLP